MHGLFNRSIQCFVYDIYGVQVWERVIQRAGLKVSNFETMLLYPDETVFSLLGALSKSTGRPVDDLCEDLGTYLVSHPSVAALRRLLRFGGETFTEFLHSLDDLHGRAKLAVETLELPQLELDELNAREFRLGCYHPDERFSRGCSFVLVGMLRAMADDYGALVLLDYAGISGRFHCISIKLLDVEFAEGRAFKLSEKIGQA
ncbi:MULTISPECIES: heme NO-binding domain-containing protein [Halocynthiibacter]|uniref:Heme NO-binding domain-containing protein n=1 Tax=Halocynthiibacter halioticoli TaxID=2986804 RepID=A0AAE3LUN4_9RHOB|nr:MULTISPECIES: heme NO-binding domain-containing protein [Halocynthiibacter]MCV6824970.1 heme NO-binding domain-containing protein [Halocynthiibacter halioticoli]MCW4057971.1 heme NO-binding domain-containing protein [Halocynthiibacter sp. SDUM655004]